MNEDQGGASYGLFCLSDTLYILQEDSTMFEYKNEVVDMPKTLKSKLSGSDMNILDERVNSRAQEGWELISSSYSVAGFAQVLLTFKRAK